MTSDEVKEAIEHRDVLLNLRAVLSTSHGRHVIKYLIKHLDVAEVPELGLEADFLRERLGFLRAGHSVFKLISEANHDIAGAILAEVEKEKYEKLYEQVDGTSDRI